MIRRALGALLALCFSGAALAQTYQPGRAPGFRPGFQFLSVGASGSALQWSKTDKGSAVSVSTDGLRATYSTTGSIRGTIGKTTPGRFSVIVNGANNNAWVGLATATAPLDVQEGNGITGIRLNSGAIQVNAGVQGASTGAIPYGSVVEVEYVSSTSINFYVNGTLRGNANPNTGGVPMFPWAFDNTNGNTADINGNYTPSNPW